MKIYLVFLLVLCGPAMAQPGDDQLIVHFLPRAPITEELKKIDNVQARREAIAALDARIQTIALSFLDRTRRSYPGRRRMTQINPRVYLVVFTSEAQAKAAAERIPNDCAALLENDFEVSISTNRVEWVLEERGSPATKGSLSPQKAQNLN